MGRDTGLRLLSESEMRALDAASVAAGVAAARLMRGAGEAVAATARDRYSDRSGIALVLAGPGQNGGDGYVAARALREAGRKVRVLSLGDPEQLSGAAVGARDAWRVAGGVISVMGAPELEDVAFAIDALFGVGLSRPTPERMTAWVADYAKADAPPVLSVDLPSGVCADTGAVLGAAFRAEATVSFVAPRRAHFLQPGAALSGELIIAEIGAPASAGAAALDGGATPVFEIAPTLWDHPLHKTAIDAHKYLYGHVLVASGGRGASGAARMAARAAQRVGAGLTTIAAPTAAMAECAARLTVEMLRDAETPDEFANLLADARINAVALGPGHAAHPGGVGRSRAFLETLLDSDAYRSGDRTAVLDADALSAMAASGPEIFSRLKGGRAVLTPHFGEFRRLFPDLAIDTRDPARDLARDGRIERALMAARRASAVVLLKGVDTVIASPDGVAAVHFAGRRRSAPQLATAGAGDVLAGLIAGLAARGWPAFEAACAGVWLHVSAARRVGAGLIATDLPEAVGAVIGDLIVEAGEDRNFYWREQATML